MDIFIVGSWVILKTVRFGYMICLYGVTIEDILWFGEVQGNESNIYNSVISYGGIVLRITGVMWFWSNMGVGIICLLICPIAYSNRGTRSARYWKGIQFDRFLVRYMIGIWWLWYHKTSLLCFSLFAALVIIVILFKIWLARVNQIEENKLVDLRLKSSTEETIEKLINLVCPVIVWLFIFYKTINYLCETIWRTMWGRGSALAAKNDMEEGRPSYSPDSSSKRNGSDACTTSSTNLSIGVGGNSNYGSGPQKIEGVQVTQNNSHVYGGQEDIDVYFDRNICPIFINGGFRFSAAAICVICLIFFYWESVNRNHSNIDLDRMCL